MFTLLRSIVEVRGVVVGCLLSLVSFSLSLFHCLSLCLSIENIYRMDFGLQSKQSGTDFGLDIFCMFYSCCFAFVSTLFSLSNQVVITHPASTTITTTTIVKTKATQRSKQKTEPAYFPTLSVPLTSQPRAAKCARQPENRCF